MILGASTILLVAAIFFTGWRMAKKDKSNYAIALIVIGALLLRMFVAADPYFHDWDEQYHAMVAKNLVAHPWKPTLYEYPFLDYNYKDWSNNHIWLHKQPMALWLMALSIKVFGAFIWAVRLPSVLLSSISVLLTYHISRSLFDRKIAFFAAFLHAIHGLSIELAGGRVATDHIDTSFTFFIELGILCGLEFAKKPNFLWAILLGLSTGKAVLTKWLPGLIIFPIGFLFCWQSRIPFAKIVFWGIFIFLVSAAVFLPWQFYIMSAFPKEAQYEYFYNNIHLTKGVEGHAHPFYYHFNKMRMIYGELIYLPMIWLLWQLAKQVKPLNFKFLVLIVWIFIPYLFFSFAATKMQAYTLFTAPAIFIVTALFYYYVQEQKVKFKYSYLATLVGILLWVLPIRYSIERIKPFAKANKEKKAFVQSVQSLDIGHLDKSKTVIFNATYPIQMMFFTGVSAYAYLPEKAKIDALKQDGIEVLVWENGKIITSPPK